MIYFLKGNVISKREDFVVVKVGNVGLQVFLPQAQKPEIKEGEEIELFCKTIFQEGDIFLVGFLKEQYLILFEKIYKIQGIGWKGALQILSLGEPEEIFQKIKEKDFQFFEKAKGLGKKKIQKIFLEFQGEISWGEKRDDKELKEALKKLGFNLQEIAPFLENLPSELSLEERIKEVLKRIGKK